MTTLRRLIARSSLIVCLATSPAALGQDGSGGTVIARPYAVASGPGYIGPTDFVPPVGAMPVAPWTITLLSGPCIGTQIPAYWTQNPQLPGAPVCLNGNPAYMTTITLGQIRNACAAGGLIAFCVPVNCGAQGVSRVFIHNNLAATLGRATVLNQSLQPMCATPTNLQININCSAYAGLLNPQNDPFVALVIAVQCCPNACANPTQDGLLIDGQSGEREVTIEEGAAADDSIVVGGDLEITDLLPGSKFNVHFRTGDYDSSGTVTSVRAAEGMGGTVISVQLEGSGSVITSIIFVPLDGQGGVVTGLYLASGEGMGGVVGIRLAGGDGMGGVVLGVISASGFDVSDGWPESAPPECATRGD